MRIIVAMFASQHLSPRSYDVLWNRAAQSPHKAELGKRENDPL
jgi:hypothetical protein